MMQETFTPSAESLATRAAGIGFFEKWLSAWVTLCIGATLATVVGVLVEVPVMLSLVACVNRTQRLFSAR